MGILKTLKEKADAKLAKEAEAKAKAEAKEAKAKAKAEAKEVHGPKETLSVMKPNSDLLAAGINEVERCREIIRQK